MEVQDIIALTLVAACVAYLIRTFQRQVQGRSGCGCAHAKNGTGCGAINRLPLVTPDAVGRPFAANGDRSTTPTHQQVP